MGRTIEGIGKFDHSSEKFTRIEQNGRNPYAFRFAQSFIEEASGKLSAAEGFVRELRLVDWKTGKFPATNYTRMLDYVFDTLEKLYSTYKNKMGVFFEWAALVDCIGSILYLMKVNIQRSASPITSTFRENQFAQQYSWGNRRNQDIDFITFATSEQVRTMGFQAFLPLFKDGKRKMSVLRRGFYFVNSL